MKQNYTDISVVLDRSGSMNTIKDDTIGGFNNFLEEQKNIPGDCNISLYQFDDVYETVYENKRIQDAPKLTLVPRNNTALLDAIAKTINKTGERLKSLSEDCRPSKVIILIQTDGQENASTEFTREKVFEMISHQRENYKWEFLFIGANMDAIKVASSYGISSNTTLTYAANSIGTQAMYRSLSSNIGNLRSNVTQDCSFTDEDRKKQEAELH